ncbi:MAG TPA: DNA sulfur modification protein DndB [Opitutae bacterium]|nr:DNA sulfur modification protein DndB [Opitutae bacterium]
MSDSNTMQLPSISPTRTIAAMRGVQAGREFYMAMCHMSFIAKHLPYPQNNVPADKVIQRHINKARIPKIAEYLVKYYDDYVLPPIIASIDGEIEWEPLSADSENMQVGILKIPDSADLIINDGQHRCAAIQHALQKRPELKYETLGVIFYIDRGVKRARQMFSDLNGHPVRTNQNINATFDSRQYLPQLTKRVIENSALLRGRVELFASGCAIGSPRIFTISALTKSNRVLLDGIISQDIETDAAICSRYWTVLEENLPEIEKLVPETITAREIKENYFYPYSIALQTLAAVANQLIKESPDTWEEQLAGIQKINWRRDNNEWEGRAMSGGRLTTGGNHPAFTKNFIKKKLGLPLSEDEKKLERQLARAKKAANV